MKNFIKTTKGKITIGILCVIIIIGSVFGLVEYTKYQESIKSNVVFTDISEIGLSEDLMTLIDTYDADTVVVNRIVDANEKVVDEATVGKYTIVFEAVSNGKATEFKKDVTFIDDQAPMISGASDKEIEYAAEINLLDGVTAEDNVDGIVEVTSTPLNNKLVGIQPIEYSAKDTAGNEAKLMINVTVKQPACAANAIWNGENCVCDAGYTGDGWTACTVEKKATSSTGSKNTSSSGGTSSKKTGGNSSVSSGNSSGNSSNEGWTVDDPTVGRVPDNVVNDCNQNYNGSCAGLVFGDGSYVIGQ